MFDLLRFVCELIFGSSLSLSHECFDYLSSNLHAIVTQIIQQSFSIALRSKRTRLLGDDLKLILKCRAISPLYGYCCSINTDKSSLFETTHQLGRTLFVQVDATINLNQNHLTNINTADQNKNFQLEKVRKKSIVCCSNILLHVEWLAIAGEQKYSQIKLSVFNKSILNIEQQLYLVFLQSKNFNEEIWNLLRYDQIALDTILSHLIEWCRNNICECLMHSCRLKKRRQLASHLIIIDCLLQNSLVTINHYLHILSPMIMTCLLYEFEVDEPLDYNDYDMKSAVDTGHVWSLRLLAAQACVKMLQRSNFLVYDIFYTRIISRLIYSLTSSSTPSSVIYAILCLFEQLGSYASRTFLLPHLLDIDSSKMFSSKSILAVLERIALMVTEK
ncbi:unnamed protein product [Rotaria sp. Silwood2]|nr:unnamed protein product [Rotaria sp. Silwood2]CAF2535647.1 unnamed protein product [Rotaria sp. Silwood2]CAF2933186.1 unnamed protein product [Rotaria sp. Silwood2]CAF3884809.1 unnamed protein product [Rotaria sp. Silwood2]CAF4161819.1 unnamed protein product [Rotaria sp. Silwood2]